MNAATALVDLVGAQAVLKWAPESGASVAPFIDPEAPAGPGRRPALAVPARAVPAALG